MSVCSVSRVCTAVSSTSASPQATINEKMLPAQPPRLYRLKQVLERIPVSKSSWFDGIKSGRYPRGLHLGPRTTVWRSDDIDHLIDSLKVAA